MAIRIPPTLLPQFFMVYLQLFAPPCRTEDLVYLRIPRITRRCVAQNGIACRGVIHQVSRSQVGSRDGDISRQWRTRPLLLWVSEISHGVADVLRFVCLFGWLIGWFVNVFVNKYVITRMGPKTERLTILRAATHETERGDHDFCLSRSHYTDTDPICRERAATAEIEPRIFSPGVARSTD